MNESAVLAMLQALIAKSSQKAVAQQFGFSPQYINDVVRGRREISEEFASRLGLERVVTFRRLDTRCEIE